MSLQTKEQINTLAVYYQELAAAANQAASVCRDYDGSEQADLACSKVTNELHRKATQIDKYISKCADISRQE